MNNSKSKDFFSRVEEALQVSEAQKKAILDASVDRIRLSDTDMRIIWANKTHAKELNIHPEDIIGKHCYTVFVKRDTPCTECPSIKALTSGKTEHTVLTRHSPGSRDGKTYLDSYAVPIKNESGDSVSCIQITRNITEQVLAEQALTKSEEKYRNLFEQSRDAISITTRNGDYVDANQSFLDLFGYTREEIEKSNAIERYINPEDRATFTNEVIQKGSVKDYEIRLKKKNGEEMDTLSSSVLRQAHDGSILGYQSIVRDITQHKRDIQTIKKREAELEMVNTQLVETNKALSVLAKNLNITRKASEKQVIQGITNYLMPLIERLQQDKNMQRYQTDLDLIVGYINNVTSRMSDDLTIPLSLSATEMRMASLIRNGMSNREIAKHLCISLYTVKTHRKNIRRKLGLHHSGLNLQAFLKYELD